MIKQFGLLVLFFVIFFITHHFARHHVFRLRCTNISDFREAICMGRSKIQRPTPHMRTMHTAKGHSFRTPLVDLQFDQQQRHPLHL